MNNISHNVFLCIFLLAFTSCTRVEDPLRNKISFTDEPIHVLDSIVKMERLLKQLPKSQVINSFVDNEGYLFVNNKKVGLLKDALSVSSIRRESVFVNFTDEDYIEFITTAVYLMKNHINSSMKDNQTGFFVYGYRKTRENTYNDLREIIVHADTTSKKFKEYYQILDRKGDMILVAPLDARLK